YLSNKAVWDDELTLIFCELCVNEANESTRIGWCPSKKTVDATEEWWAEKIQLMWQIFGGIVATRENTWAPSSSVLSSRVPMGNDTPNEGFGDSDEHSNENECIPSNEVPSNPSHETPNRIKQTLGVSMASPRKSVNEVIFPHSQYTISNVMDALHALGDEIPKKDELYYFAIKMFQILVKREVFLNLDPDDRVRWLRREYAEQNPIASFSSL
ncbi:hypothetical protein Goshw_023582, partial [Gossypium schwendimanii]|nr:hypothetical protein [Gossypium schwendimanii]